MNLELVEERCLKYLAESANPLAPVGALLAFCRRDISLADLSAQELLAFLRHHELVRIIDPPPITDPACNSAGSDDESSQEPRAILTTRIPSPREMSHMMLEQMQKMTDALRAAIDDAETHGNNAAAAQLRQALERASTLRARMDELP